MRRKISARTLIVNPNMTLFASSRKLSAIIEKIQALSVRIAELFMFVPAASRILFSRGLGSAPAGSNIDRCHRQERSRECCRVAKELILGLGDPELCYTSISRIGLGSGSEAFRGSHNDLLVLLLSPPPKIPSPRPRSVVLQIRTRFSCSLSFSQGSRSCCFYTPCHLPLTGSQQPCPMWTVSVDSRRVPFLGARPLANGHRPTWHTKP